MDDPGKRSSECTDDKSRLADSSSRQCEECVCTGSARADVSDPIYSNNVVRLPLKDTLSGNSFFGLKIDDEDTIQDEIEGCPYPVAPLKSILKVGKRQNCRCLQCGGIYYGRGSYCVECSDATIAKFSNNSVHSDIELLSYSSFAR